MNEQTSTLNDEMKTFESVSFEASIRKANAMLRVTGIQTDDNENNQTFMQRMWNRKFYIFFHLMTYTEVLGELAWFVEKGVMQRNFVYITYTVPCATFCFLGSAKSYYRIKYGHHINDLIHSLRKLQAIQSEYGIHTDPTAFEAIRKMIAKLRLAIKILTVINLIAVGAFFIFPIMIMVYEYRVNGVLELRFPFLVIYPFDAYDLRIFPFIYLHQTAGAVFGVFTVFGPDCLYYIFCTFVQVQFYALQYDLERIVKSSASLRLQRVDETFRGRLKACIDRHKELIRCSNLIETAYSRSSFINFVSSSLLLCLAGFNVMAYADVVIFFNFIGFLFMCVMQIYLLCDYGDKVSQASMSLSSAVYNSQWYMVDTKTANDLLMILMRAQKPCKLTAYSFAQMNLLAFTRILSTSWSYFALLQSVYNAKK